jgi:hypothetical protein
VAAAGAARGSSANATAAPASTSTNSEQEALQNIVGASAEQEHLPEESGNQVETGTTVDKMSVLSSGFSSRRHESLVPTKAASPPDRN